MEITKASLSNMDENGSSSRKNDDFSDFSTFIHKKATSEKVALSIFAAENENKKNNSSQSL